MSKQPSKRRKAKPNLDRHHLEAMIRVGTESTDAHVSAYAQQTGRDVGYEYVPELKVVEENGADERI